MASYVVSNVKNIIVQKLTVDQRRYVRFANVRFDDKNGSNIYYHDNIRDFSSSVDAHLPTMSHVFPDESNDTDIVPVLKVYYCHFSALYLFQSFLNSNSPLCGSFAIFLVKRYTKCNSDFELWNTYQQLTAQKIMINVIQSNYVAHSGGLGAIDDLAGYSGGIMVEAGKQWSNDDSGFFNMTNLLMGIPYTDNLLYASYPARQFNLTNMYLEQLTVPSYAVNTVNVTLAITTEVYSGSHLQSISLTLVNRLTQERSFLNYTQSDYYTNTDLIWEIIKLQSGTDYDVIMTFRTSFVGYLAIRMFIDKPLPDDWNVWSTPPPAFAQHEFLRVEGKPSMSL